MPTEAETIAASAAPVTAASLAVDLRALGLGTGATVIVHTSVSALGWVVGGAQAVVEALLDVLGPDGTLVVPTQSGQLSDPSGWGDPPVPPAWHGAIRASMPAYDPAITPTRGVGAVPDVVRSLPDSVRSPHPLVSFCAVGPLAATICGEHPLGPQFGDSSPLGRLHDVGADVLLLGVGHGSNTSLHLAEWSADWPGRTEAEHRAPIAIDGERQWVTWQDLEPDEDDFDELGAEFAASGSERSGPVGEGIGRLCRVREVVAFGAEWISTHRDSATWWRADRGDLQVTVTVQPNARRNEVVGVRNGALALKVAAPPVDGKANEALRRYVAELFGVRLSAVRVKLGASTRRKLVTIVGLTRPTFTPPS